MSILDFSDTNNLSSLEKVLTEDLLEAVKRPEADPAGAVLAAGRIYRGAPAGIPASVRAEAEAWLRRLGQNPKILDIGGGAAEEHLGELFGLLHSVAAQDSDVRVALTEGGLLGASPTEEVSDGWSAPVPPERWAAELVELRDDLESYVAALSLATFEAPDGLASVLWSEVYHRLSGADELGQAIVAEVHDALVRQGALLPSWLAEFGSAANEGEWWLEVIRLQGQVSALAAEMARQQ